MAMSKSIFGAAMILFLGVANQNANAECEDALVLATYSENSTYHSDWRLAKFVSEKAYMQANHVGDVNAVIYGVPVGASYNDFEENYKRKEEQYNESLTLDQAKQIFWVGLDPQTGKNYADCLYAQSEKPLKLAVIASTTDAIIVEVNWRQPGGPKNIEVQWVPSKIGKFPLPRKFADGRTPIPIARQSKEISIVASYKGFESNVIKLLPFPSPPKRLMSCLEYRVPNKDSVACNAKTYDGYFWKVLTPRSGVYHEGGVATTGAPECGPNLNGKKLLGSVGVTARYPTYHVEGFEDVGTEFVTAGPAHGEDFNCNWTSSEYKNVCGQFKAECTKMPESASSDMKNFQSLP